MVAYGEGNERLGTHKVMQVGDEALQVGKQTAQALIEEINSGGAVDRHAGDNLIPWLLLLGGAIRPSSLTPHTLTNLWVCRQFVGDRIRNCNGVIFVENPLTE